MTCAFQASFSRWTVGFGIEGQWNALRAAVGLERLPGLQAGFCIKLRLVI